MMRIGVIVFFLLSQSVARAQTPDGPCQRQLKSITMNPLIIGARVPQCDKETGNYKVRQCSGSVGSCWCVDEKTGEDVGEPLTINENGLPECEPDCIQELRKLPSFLIHGEPFYSVSYIPQCDMSTGYFIPKQCSRDGKQCWCVSKLGKEVENTRTTDSGLKCTN